MRVELYGCQSGMYLHHKCQKENTSFSLFRIIDAGHGYLFFTDLGVIYASLNPLHPYASLLRNRLYFSIIFFKEKCCLL